MLSRHLDELKMVLADELVEALVTVTSLESLVCCGESFQEPGSLSLQEGVDGFREVAGRHQRRPGEGWWYRLVES